MRSEKLTFLPTIAGMFISPNGLDKTGLFLFFSVSKQNNTIFNDLESGEEVWERIFYIYLSGHL